MVAVTAIGRRSTTGKETVGMTLEVAAEAQEITEAEVKASEEGEIQIVKAEEENLGSIETIGLQKDQVEVVGAAVTISVNRETITPEDEYICTASETGFDILQALNAAYVWTGHQQ